MPRVHQRQGRPLELLPEQGTAIHRYDIAISHLTIERPPYRILNTARENKKATVVYQLTAKTKSTVNVEGKASWHQISTDLDADSKQRSAT